MDDWLDIKPDPTPADIVSAALADNVHRPGQLPQAKLDLPDRHREMVLALNALNWKQRQWIRAYLHAGCVTETAFRALRKVGSPPPDRSTIYRWSLRPEYQRALALMKNFMAEKAGLDREAVLIKTGIVLESAMTPKPILHMGEPTGFEEINGNVAMRAIEFAGKVNKMTDGDREGPRVTLVVNIANREDLETVVAAQ